MSSSFEHMYDDSYHNPASSCLNRDFPLASGYETSVCSKEIASKRSSRMMEHISDSNHNLSPGIKGVVTSSHVSLF